MRQSPGGVRNGMSLYRSICKLILTVAIITAVPLAFTTDVWSYEITDSGGDCTLIGTWDSTEKICTINGDVTGTIQIKGDNITLDGNGKTLTVGTNDVNGVEIIEQNYVTVRNLNITGNDGGSGIFIEGEWDEQGTYGRHTLSNNSLTGNNYGIRLFYSSENTISGNEVYGNFTGIFLESHDEKNDLIGNNVRSNSEYGIDLRSSKNNKIIENTVGENVRAGIHLTEKCDGTAIYHNNILQNVENDNDAGSIWYNLGLMQGNYWSSYTGADEDGDCIGDTDVPAGAGDLYPFMKQDGWKEGCTITVVEIAIDIKPGSCPNPLNATSKGILPVAVLGTQDLDVTKIDMASIRLEGVAPIRSSVEDIGMPGACYDYGPDGVADLSLKFDTQEVVGALGEVNDGDKIILELTGQLVDGTEIAGEDEVLVLGKGKGKKK